MVVRNCWEFFKSKKPVNFNFFKNRNDWGRQNLYVSRKAKDMELTSLTDQKNLATYSLISIS